MLDFIISLFNVPFTILGLIAGLLQIVFTLIMTLMSGCGVILVIGLVALLILA